MAILQSTLMQTLALRSNVDVHNSTTQNTTETNTHFGQPLPNPPLNPPPNPDPNQFNHHDVPYFRPPKVDLPRFYGEDAWGWLTMAERHLKTQKVPPQEAITIVASHFGPDACMWVNAFEERHPMATYPQFAAAFLEHYGAGTSMDFQTALSQLQQTTNVNDFILQFTKLSCRAYGWTNAQLLPLFIGGLKPEIQYDVGIMQPQTLALAQRLARMYEAKLAAIKASRVSRQPVTWSGSQRVSSTSSTFAPHHQTQHTQVESSIRQLSAQEQRERRALGLCFQCKDKWSRNHVCKKPIMTMLESLDVQGDVNSDEESEQVPKLEDDQIIPLHAITNSKLAEMMRFKGTIKGVTVDIFVDCGSASNLMDPKLAEQLGLSIVPMEPHKFMPVNWQPLSISRQAVDVPVDIQGYEFTSSYRLLTVPGCDVLLGAPWLETLGMFGWHFLEKTMVFEQRGRCYVLYGLKCSPRQFDQNSLLNLMSMEQLDHNALSSPEEASVWLYNPVVQCLIDQYAELFAAPTKLPPVRSIDHTIPILLNSGPVNVRPYRYPHSQKEELEKQVNEMLSSGVIRPSRSPFSSPVLLVRKKEGTLRFCVDYRSLNDVTVKDRFPIPVVDELWICDLVIIK
ncbi:uncharacterized protein LOC126803466 [Argentina anserina]|uniref:uncharacterized protein LOC126803466 n=1 Tax=Argentina anserina TaxID=57926 RepID=UPI00217694A2|nr:uncharacterized protein LOC126803466 [Potentilla anserina]